MQNLATKLRDTIITQCPDCFSLYAGYGMKDGEYIRFPQGVQLQDNRDYPTNSVYPGYAIPTVLYQDGLINYVLINYRRMNMKHQIRHRYTDTVLFECDVPDDVQAIGMATRYALEKAVKDGAYLTGAYLSGANLTDAKLYGASLTDVNLSDAKLTGANLTCACLTDAYMTGANMYGVNLRGACLTDACLTDVNLRGANMTGANLTGAYLTNAKLSGANLTGAKLTGANLTDEEKLIGDRPVLIVGPIGSRGDCLTAYLTDKGIRLRGGCFFGDVVTFRAKLEETHGDNDHAAEYRAALALIEKHAEIWTPKLEPMPEADDAVADVALVLASVAAVAAAPELLEALADCVAHMHWTRPQGETALKKAKAVIAKSTGEPT